MSGPPKNPVVLGLLVVGSIGLIGAMLVDGLAVIGRHTGLPLTGSIELSQACVVLLSSCAIATATLQRAHAAVDLLHQMLGPRGQALMMRFAAALGVLFVLALAAGAAWLASDLWNGDERTELLSIPLAWLRIVFIACLAIAAAGFAIQVFVVKPSERGSHGE